MWEMYEDQESAMNRSMNAGVYAIGTNVIIRASLCEPHTSELNGGFFIFIYIYIYLPYVRRSVKCKLTLF